MTDEDAPCSAPQGGAEAEQRCRVLEGLSRVVAKDGEREGRAYGIELGKIADSRSYSEPAPLSAICEAILVDASVSEPVRYAALYADSIYLRRNNQLRQLGLVFERYGRAYRGHASYPLIYLTYEDAAGLQGNYLTSIHDARVLGQQHPDDAGIQHLFARIVLTALERYGSDKIEDSVITEAIVAAQKAIEESGDYAKFYATKAGLLVWLERWDEALAAIDEAISREDPSRATYGVIISQYQYVKTKIMLSMSEAELSGRLEDAAQKAEKSTASTMEILGFFAGIISFILSSIQIAGEYDPFDAACLIVVMMGALLVAFSAFSVLLGRRGAGRREFLVAGSGTVLIGVVLYVLRMV